MGNLRDRGYFDLEPDLAIEILSPNDRPGETHRKIGDYFGAGTRLVWVIDPSTEQVVVHHPDGRSHSAKTLRSFWKYPYFDTSPEL